MEHTTDAAGICPVCDHDNLEYSDMIFENDAVYYETECTDCGWKGQEWYTLKFDRMVTKPEKTA
jgi:C4-type Zn-finger protein